MRTDIYDEVSSGCRGLGGSIGSARRTASFVGGGAIRTIRSIRGIRTNLGHRCRHVRLVASLMVLVGCRGAAEPAPLFELLSPRATGVGFSNELPEAPDFNILNYLYY